MTSIVRVLSLGVGVQSSTIAHLYEEGKLGPKPDFAIFSDTKVEPKAVYDYLEVLRSKIKSFPIHIVSKGHLVNDVLNGDLSPPFFVYKDNETYKRELNEWSLKRGALKKLLPDAKSYQLPNRPSQKGMIRRQCTYNYKIRPVQQKIRELLGYKKYQRVKEKIELTLGISTDEITRMKDSRVKWITHKFPLIDDLGWSRDDCKKYYLEKGLPTPPRSSCWMCPYKNDDEWIHLRDSFPEEFDFAVNFDKKIRKLKGLKYKNYLHRSCIPLDEVVFKPKNQKEELSIFSAMNNECDGLCGV